MNSGFAKGANIKTPIDIQWYKNKPCVYLSGVDLDILYPIVLIIESMLASADNDKPDVDTLIAKIESIKIKAIEMKKLIDDQKKLTAKLEQMLNQITLE
jgi:hypothetical protein